MGSAISSTLTMGLTYCCCTATGSICNSCLGTTAPGTTGRKRSVLLLSIAIALSLWFQYMVAPAIVGQSGLLWKSYRVIPGMGKIVYKAWHDPCERYETDDDNDEDQLLLKQCVSNSGVYRPMAVASLFFAVNAVATRLQPSLNREVWPAKITVYLFAVFFTMFLSSAPIFTGLFLWFARIGATLFLLLQQVILIDVAYNWNEDWIERSDRADRIDYGSGAAWLRAIVATCAAFYGLALGGIVVMYKYFGSDGCTGNTWIITLTLLGVILFTGVQLSGCDGSLLTSSIMAVYVTYLAYGMVSKNPEASCNPQLGTNDTWGIVIGLTLTAVSLAWIGWAWTAEDRLNVEGIQSARTVASSNPTSSGGAASSSDGQINLDAPFLDPEDRPTSGLVLDSSDGGDAADVGSGGGGGMGRDIWKLNVAMVLICCFVAMTLTGWGTVESFVRYDDEGDGSEDMEYRAANPTAGRVNMIMIGLSQWTAISLYVWTLVAPRLFPDREFF